MHLLFIIFAAFTITEINGNEIDCKQVPLNFYCKNDELDKRCNFLEKCQELRQNPKVKTFNLTLLFAAKCPYSQNFSLNYLKPVYEEYRNWFNIEYVPFGHSKIFEVSLTIFKVN